MQVRLQSPFMQRLGLNAGDLPSCCMWLNEIIERLVYTGGDSGWWGGWARVAFQASRTNPYITLPSQFARAINLDVCSFPVKIQNEFYEFLEDGIGLQPPTGCMDWCGALEGYERGVFATLVDLPAASPQYLKAYSTNPGDVGKRLLIQGAKDQNGNGLYTTEYAGQANGAYITLVYPGGALLTNASGIPLVVSGWDSILKDITYGDVVLNSVDAATGVETPLSRYKPWETNPTYRRYYLNSLPNNCCKVGTDSPAVGTVSIQAMCKYEFTPVANDTDQLLIGNVPALIEEGLSILEGSKEDGDAANRELRHRRNSIKLLQDEMRHYLGERRPAVVVAPFGTARLEKRRVGTLR